MLSRKEFLKAYHQVIVGRSFVEDISYYENSARRFWQCFDAIQSLELPASARVIDIGGGIMAVLLNRLLGFNVSVGDVNERARADVEAAGLKFELLNLMSDGEGEAGNFDLIVFQEVIEHIPQPPYIVLNRIKKMLSTRGLIFLTTPNGHQLRNIIYMLMGKEILDMYRYPNDGESLGHQHEYTMRQMQWQAGAAGLEIVAARHYNSGFKGANWKAKTAHFFFAPFKLVPHWKTSLMMILRETSSTDFSGLIATESNAAPRDLQQSFHRPAARLQVADRA